MTTHPGQQQQGKRHQRWPWIVGGVIAVIGFGGAILEGGDPTSGPDDGSIAGSAAALDQTILETVRAACAPGSSYVTVGDSGKTLLIDHQGDDDAYGASIDQVVCITLELAMPDSVIAQIDATRALDGRQSASWSGYEMSWAYHPDTGMDLVITEN